MRPKRSDLLRFVHGEALKSYRILSSKPDAAEGDAAVPLGEGGSGVVFLAEQVLYKNVKIRRAVKFFVYRDDIAEMTVHATSGPVSTSQFFDELVNAASFRHENIIKVIDVGVYESTSADAPIPYIVTDYVDGPTLKQVIATDDFGAYFRSDDYQILEVLLQLCRGISHLHRQRFYHCDIAPKNVFLQGRASELVVVVGDLGIGRTLSATSESEDKVAFVTGTRDYCPPEVQRVLLTHVPLSEFRCLQPRWDVYAVARTGLDILDKLVAAPAPRLAWHRALGSLLADVVDGSGAQDIDALQDGIQWLRPIHRTVAEVPELMETFRGKRTRLLAIASAVTSSRIRHILHHPTMLRLRHVPQLVMGPSVFAGANHTRYEHSQGVFENMRRYLLALVDSEGFLRYFRQSHVETALVAAALANLGSVPFGHVIGALMEGDSSLFKEFDQRSLLDELFADESHGASESLQRLLRSEFPSVDLDVLRDLLCDIPRPQSDPGLRFLRAAIHGSLGVVVVDYVRRDAWHLGLSRGDPVDLTELIQHIEFRDGTLAIRSSGLSVVEQIIAQRYWLYHRVYWNQPNRSLHAMIRHLLLELHEEKTLQRFGQALRGVALWADERTVLEFLLGQAEEAGRKDLEELARLLLADRPRIFEEVFQISRAESDASLTVVCDRLSSLAPRQLADVRSRLEGHLCSSLGLPADRVQVLIDIPKRRRGLGEDVNVITHSGVPVPLAKLSGIVEGVQRSFSDHIQRARVFVNPAHRGAVRSEERKIAKVARDFLTETYGG